MPHTPCLLQINNTSIFVAAGGTNEAYILDWLSQEWTQLENMSFERSFASCGRVGDDIVVVGHNQGDEAGNSTEIFSLTNKTWRMGPSVPGFGICFNSSPAVQLKDTFLLVGGYDCIRLYDKIYEFDAVNYDWIEREEKLASMRYVHCALGLA